MPGRRVLIGGCALYASIVAYQLTIMLLPGDSWAAVAVSDLGFCLVEVTALGLCLIAALSTNEPGGRWIWLLVGSWLALNLFADVLWSYHELMQGVEPPSPGLTDAGYLLSYAAAFGAVLVATWKASGRTRLFETVLDSTMFTIGAAGLFWPFFFSPLVEATNWGADYWVSLSLIHI
jgi:hypothetical protein